jgi:serine/threonine-protein kinase
MQPDESDEPSASSQDDGRSSLYPLALVETYPMGRPPKLDEKKPDVIGGAGGRPSPAGSPAALNNPASRGPAEGTLLGGVYRVVRRLGEGAMGVILLAHDERLRRPVAIKLLLPERMNDSAQQQRLLDEARAMARVQHPNVVEIYAFGEHQEGTGQSAPYFVMQYVEGMTLDAYARSQDGKPFAIDEALVILDQICLGVAAIHAAGLAHRDLKPSNILIGPGLRVFVADLGIAKELEQEDDLPSFSGTPAYIAPEVAQRREIERALMPRVDVYALGLLAYRLLARRLPFQAKNVLELYRLHAYHPPPPPSSLNPELPPSFDAPLLAALAKQPEARTENAEAFRRALLHAREDAPSSRVPMRVLLVDDSEDFRTVLASVLEAGLPNAHVVTASDGGSALEMIQVQVPSLAVIDLMMPGMNGIELTAAVRALPFGTFPIIVVTGTGGASEWQHLTRLGASAFLIKPFDAGQLVTLARSLLGLPSHVPERK